MVATCGLSIKRTHAGRCATRAKKAVPRCRARALHVSCTAIESDVDIARRSLQIGIHNIPLLGAPKAVDLHYQPSVTNEVAAVTPDPFLLHKQEQKDIAVRLKACDTFQALYDFVEVEGPRFNSVNVSSALAKLARLHLACKSHTGLRYQFSNNGRQQPLLAEVVLPTIRRLNQLVLARVRDFKARDVAQCFWAYGHLGSCDDLIWDVLCEKSCSIASEFKSIDCAHVLFCFGKLERLHSELFYSVLQVALSLLENFKPQEVSNLVWGWAKAIPPPSHAIHLGSCGTSKTHKAKNPPPTGEATWQCGSLRSLPPWPSQTMRSVPSSSPTNSSRFPVTHVARGSTPSTSSRSRLPHQTSTARKPSTSTSSKLPGRSSNSPPPRAKQVATSVLKAVFEHVKWHMDDYGVQELTTTLWSIARLGLRPPSTWLQQVEIELTHRLPAAKPQDVANALYAFARLNYKPTRFLDTVPAYFCHRLSEFAPQELANVLVGYTHSRHYCKAIMDEMARVVVRYNPALSDQDMTILVWSYAIFKHQPAAVAPEFMDTLTRSLGKAVPRLKPQAIATVIKAWSTLQWHPPAVLPALVRSAEARVLEFKPCELAALLYGLSCMGWNDLSVYQTAVGSVIRTLEEQGRSAIEHRELNSVLESCQRVGWVPWHLVEFAETKGVRLRYWKVVEKEGDGTAPSTPTTPTTTITTDNNNIGSIDALNSSGVAAAAAAAAAATAAAVGAGSSGGVTGAGSPDGPRRPASKKHKAKAATDGAGNEAAGEGQRAAGSVSGSFSGTDMAAAGGGGGRGSSGGTAAPATSRYTASSSAPTAIPPRPSASFSASSPSSTSSSSPLSPSCHSNGVSATSADCIGNSPSDNGDGHAKSARAAQAHSKNGVAPILPSPSLIQPNIVTLSTPTPTMKASGVPRMGSQALKHHTHAINLPGAPHHSTTTTVISSNGSVHHMSASNGAVHATGSNGTVVVGVNSMEVGHDSPPMTNQAGAVCSAAAQM